MERQGIDPYNTVTAKVMPVIDWEPPVEQDFGDTITVEILLPERGDLLAEIEAKTA